MNDTGRLVAKSRSEGYMEPTTGKSALVSAAGGWLKLLKMKKGLPASKAAREQDQRLGLRPLYGKDSM